MTVGGKFSGVGILVVRNAELVANSAFRWEGLIIVTGTGVGFRVVEEENKEVYGAVMINETVGRGYDTDYPGASRCYQSVLQPIRA